MLNFAYCSDKYQYTMGKSFYDSGMKDQHAVFNMFYRKAPENNNWAVVSGVDEVIEMIENLGNMDPSFFEKFLPGEEYAEFRGYLSAMKFTGTVYAMREGEIVFPNQPIIIVEGPLIEAQVLETPMLCIMNHQMAVATKASRVCRATNRPVSEFGSRRAHGPWAATYGAKAAVIAGCSATSNILTGVMYDYGSTGTMAHSYVTSFGCSVAGEFKAFDTYIKTHKGEPLILLIDTLIERPNDDVSEVAVFCDPMSFLYCKENADLHQTTVRYNVDSIIRSGAPFRFYNLNDLEKLDIDKFKVFIFLNAIDPKNREFIKEKLADKYKVFIGAAGYVYSDKLDTAGITDLTGIKVSEFKTDKVHTVNYAGQNFGFTDVVSPMFRVEDNDAQVLGEYTDGGVAIARKDKGFYCAVGNIPYEFVLDVNRAAGVHIYNDEGGAIAVTTDMISCYGKQEENTLRLPFDCTLTDLYTGEVIQTENGVAKYTDKVYETRVFKITK